MQNVFQQMLDRLPGSAPCRSGGKRGDPHQRAFEPADVAANARREELVNIIVQFDLQGARFLPQNGKTRLDVGRLQFRGQAPLETRNQAVLEIGDLRGRTIAREHDLLVPVEEGIEGVKEFLLRSFFAGEKLNIIDQEQICLAVTLAEFDQRIVLNRVDEFVDEELAREIHDFRRLLSCPKILADRLHQMRFAQPDAAVNEKRVVGPRGRLCHGQTGGVRDLVVRPDDK